MSTPILKRNAVLLAKIESNYGVDSVPTAAEAMLVRSMSINPLEGVTVDLNYLRGYFGAPRSLRASHYMSVKIEMGWMPGARATVGDPSPIDALYRCCGMSRTARTTVTSTAQSASNSVSGTAQTQSSPNALYIQLASGTTQADDFFNGATIVITGGTGAGQERVIADWTLSTKMAKVAVKWRTIPDNTSTYIIKPFIKLASGADAVDNFYAGLDIRGTGNTARVITAYDGTTKVATVNRNWTVVPTTETYSIAEALRYDPVGVGFESSTLVYGDGGLLHKLVGVRGNVSINMKAKDVPTIGFDLIGLYGGIVDGTVTGTYTAFANPAPITTANTVGLLYGRAFDGASDGLQLEAFSFDLGNTVTHRQLVGAENVLITDRSAKGSLTIDMTTRAVMDWFEVIRNSDTGRLYLSNGSTLGLNVAINLPNIQLDSLSYGESDGVVTAEMGFRALPIVGNDEATFIEK